MRSLKKTSSLTHAGERPFAKLAFGGVLLANSFMLPHAEGNVRLQTGHTFQAVEREEKTNYSEKEVANALEKAVPGIKEKIAPLPKKWWETDAKKYPDIACENTIDPDIIMDSDERRELEAKMARNAAFGVMCRTLTGIVNAHEGMTPEILAHSLKVNERAIEEFVNNRYEYYKGKRKISREVIYHAAIAAVMIGNVYGVNPSRVLPTIDHESGYNPDATMIVKKGDWKAMYVGLYQIGVQTTARHTYYKDTRYARDYMFNVPIEKLGGYAMRDFPVKEGPTYEITNNTLYAVLSLVSRGYGKCNWSQMYEGYAGIPGTPAAGRFASYMQWYYREFSRRFDFVLLPKRQEVLTGNSEGSDQTDVGQLAD